MRKILVTLLSTITDDGHPRFRRRRRSRETRFRLSGLAIFGCAAPPVCASGLGLKHLRVAAGKIQVSLILGLAFVESLAIYSSW